MFVAATYSELFAYRSFENLVEEIDVNGPELKYQPSRNRDDVIPARFWVCSTDGVGPTTR